MKICYSAKTFQRFQCTRGKMVKQSFNLFWICSHLLYCNMIYIQFSATHFRADSHKIIFAQKHIHSHTHTHLVDTFSVNCSVRADASRSKQNARTVDDDATSTITHIVLYIFNPSYYFLIHIWTNEYIYTFIVVFVYVMFVYIEELIICGMRKHLSQKTARAHQSDNNIYYAYARKKNLYIVYTSEHNSSCHAFKSKLARAISRVLLLNSW